MIKSLEHDETSWTFKNQYNKTLVANNMGCDDWPLDSTHYFHIGMH
jgi:hypothetical protein